MRIAVIASVLSVLAAPALAADSAEGVWSPEGGDAKVRIEPCPGDHDRLCGVIVWVRGEPERRGGVSGANAAPHRSAVGVELMRDFQRLDATRWIGGKIYDPQSGRTYDANMRLNPDGTLRVEGCFLVLCMGQNWRRTG